MKQNTINARQLQRKKKHHHLRDREKKGKIIDLSELYTHASERRFGRKIFARRRVHEMCKNP